MGVYGRAPLAFERGEGARLISTDGEAYLDCVAGIATNALGHAHPRLVEAVKTQSEKLWHVSNIFRIPEQEKLADRLKEQFRILAKMEGKETGDWVLIDGSDVIIHVFRPEVREFYQLEKMWMPSSGHRIDTDAAV